MKHLFDNGEGEIVAADTMEEAANYHDCELGGADTTHDGWFPIGDSDVIPMKDAESGEVNKQTAAELAAEYDTSTLVSTTYN